MKVKMHLSMLSTHVHIKNLTEFLGINFQPVFNYFVWLRITDEGSIPKMRIWSILLIKSDLKWCIHSAKDIQVMRQVMNWLWVKGLLSYDWVRSLPFLSMCCLNFKAYHLQWSGKRKILLNHLWRKNTYNIYVYT